MRIAAAAREQNSGIYYRYIEKGEIICQIVHSSDSLSLATVAQDTNCCRFLIAEISWIFFSTNRSGGLFLFTTHSAMEARETHTMVVLG